MKRSDTMEIRNVGQQHGQRIFKRLKIPIRLAIIQENALSLHEDIRKSNEDEKAEKENFVASKGWFQRFKNRYGFKNIKIQGEIPLQLKLFQNNLRRLQKRKITALSRFSMQMKQGYNGSECYQERILLNKKNLHLVSRHQKIMSHYLSGGINMATRSFDRFLCTEGK